VHLKEWPGLHTLPNLKAFELCNSEGRNLFPRLAGPSSLQSLRLSGHVKLQKLRPLDGFKNLQTLCLSECYVLPELPRLHALTALQLLNLYACKQLQQLPPLDSLKSLQKLNLNRCYKLLRLPPLDCLTALQDLMLGGCKELLGSCLRLPSTQGSGVLVYRVSDKRPRILKGEHVVE
jgi:hypothetical protein